MEKRKIGYPLAIAGFAAVGILVLLADDVGALSDWAIQATWMFKPAEQRPTGTWQGVFQGRTITLHLELDTLSEKDSWSQHERKNGYFFKRIALRRGERTVQGTITVSGSGGKTDYYETEGSPNLRGDHAFLNVHGADGLTGIIIEKADVTFNPPHAEAALRYRVPGTSGYVTAGVVWSAVATPGVFRLERTGL